MLHGKVIYYLLSKEYRCRFIQNGKDALLRMPRFLVGYEDMHRSVIVYWKESRQEASYDTRGSLFVCNKRSAPMISDKYNKVVVEDDVSEQRVFNSLLRIFAKFDTWHNSMKSSVQRLAVFQELIDNCDDIVEEPMSLVDRQFNYIAYSALSHERGLVDRYVDNGHLDIETVQKLMASPGFRNSLDIKGVYSSAGESNFFCRNIFFQNEYIGKLHIRASGEHDQDEYHKCILDYTGNFIEELYSRCGSFKHDMRRVNQLKMLLLDILHGRAVQPDAVKSLMAENNHRPDDNFYLIQFRTNLNEEVDSRIAYLSLQLEERHPGSMAFLFEGKMLQVINISENQRLTGDDFFEMFPLFLRDTLLLAGMSRQFSDIMQLRSAYRQSGIAFSEGRLVKPMHWYYKFDDYAFEYLLQNGRGDFRPEEICAPEIITLREHDKQNNTQYYKTVYSYIHNRYNASDTAKDLFIARSSLLNRLVKINNLTGIDWADFNARLYMSISCKLFGP